jgi:hypothetical protein
LARSLFDEHDTAQRIAVFFCNPTALGLGIVLIDEFCSDSGDEGFKSLVPAVFLVVKDAVSVNDPSYVAGSVGTEDELATGGLIGATHFTSTCDRRRIFSDQDRRVLSILLSGF